MRTQELRQGYKNNSDDKNTQAIIYEGANQTQLCRLFKVDKDRLRERLLHVKPDGKRRGAPVWKVETAAPYLVKPKFDVEQYIRNMNYADLPAHLTKEFWAGQRAKQAFEAEEGDLWRTADVLEAITELLRLVRMSVMLIPDRLERVTSLSEKQRELLIHQTDELLDELREAIIRRFRENRTGSVTQEDVAQRVAEAEKDTSGPEEDDYSDL